jgi:hypothetical protein
MKPLRWILVLPAALVGCVATMVAFTLVGWTLQALHVMPLDEWPEPDVDMALTAACMAVGTLLSGCAMAPQHRTATALGLLGLGMWAAWELTQLWFFPEGHPKAYQSSTLPFWGAVSGGVAGTVLVWAWERRRGAPGTVAAVLALVLMAGCARAPGDAAATLPLVRPENRLQGVTLDAREPVPPGALAAIRDMGATHVFVVPFGWMADLDDPEVRYSPDARWFSESDAGIRALAAEADTLGLRLGLKPQLWVRDGAFTGDVAMRSEADWIAWEATYGAFILHHARLAADVGADVLVIGTELGTAARTRPAFFRRLAAAVREVFAGQITYASNWYGDAEHVAFWDALDVVGVQAYFPLAEGPDPSPAALRQGWQRHLPLLERLARTSGRPVVFTEVGYRSHPDAARRPWQWPERGADEPSDSALQARLYEAFFAEVWPRPWFGGAVVWKFYADSSRIARRGASDYTPQGKPAEAVLRRYFGALRRDSSSAPRP